MTNETKPLEEMSLEELRDLARKKDDEAEKQRLIRKIRGIPEPRFTMEVKS